MLGGADGSGSDSDGVIVITSPDTPARPPRSASSRTQFSPAALAFDEPTGRTGDRRRSSVATTVRRSRVASRLGAAGVNTSFTSTPSSAGGAANSSLLRARLVLPSSESDASDTDDSGFNDNPQWRARSSGTPGGAGGSSTPVRGAASQRAVLRSPADSVPLLSSGDELNPRVAEPGAGRNSLAGGATRVQDANYATRAHGSNAGDRSDSDGGGVIVLTDSDDDEPMDMRCGMDARGAGEQAASASPMRNVATPQAGHQPLPMQARALTGGVRHTPPSAAANAVGLAMGVQRDRSGSGSAADVGGGAAPKLEDRCVQL